MVVPGCAFSNCWFVEATRSGQPVCASTWSQTVILLAAERTGPSVRAAAVEAATANAATSATAAMNRGLIDDPPNESVDGLGCSAPTSGRTGVVRCGRQLVHTTWPRREPCTRDRWLSRPI